MRSSKLNYLVVGLFVSAMIVVLVVSVAMLTGRTGAVDSYFAVYKNVTGVKFGTQVIYEGYPIGQVEKVTPQPKSGGMVFRVDFSVLQGWKIPNDSSVEIAAPSLLSAKTLSIHAGASKTALSPGDVVTSLPTTDIFGAMSSVAGRVGAIVDTDIKPLLITVRSAVANINKFLVNDGTSLIKDVNGLVKDLNDRLPRIAEDVEVFTANMNQASEEVMKLASGRNRKQIEKILKNMDATTSLFQNVLGETKTVIGNLDKLVVDPKANVDGILKETRYIVDSVSRHIDSINQNMEGAARNMNEFSRQIRANPGLLLGGSPQQDQGKSR